MTRLIQINQGQATLFQGLSTMHQSLSYLLVELISCSLSSLSQMVLTYLKKWSTRFV
ncbi:unnamed protein product [Brassica rapa subsp. trilocularis]|uniref:(rape) hypothetical protein n=1 Tax=Brassica napus TaxID=3708 RepID=A0A816PLA8_BRANA|nr:unnamed protein product [Brassica napus]